MNKVLRMLTVLSLLVCFGFTQEEVVSESPVITISGELSSDILYNSDAAEGESSISFSSPYTGLRLTGDGWELSTQILDGDVVVEEAKYSWSINDNVSLTFGQQADVYGIAWGLHRPSNNSWVSTPRDHSIYEGVGLSASVWGVTTQAFYGNDEYWATRLSYSLLDHSIGLSLNSNDALLLDVSGTASVDGVITIGTSFEYDLSEEGDGAYWYRTELTPDLFKGVSILVGYSDDGDDATDAELIYGVKYKCSDNVFITSELHDSDNGYLIRASYTF